MKPTLLLLSISLLSCSTEKPISSLPSHNNQTYQVDYLFEHDGCKVYRFYDRGNYIYFTSCSGQAMAGGDSARIINTTSNHTETQ